ncbi:unnamed protein product [Cyclocybe aegerita]|uniref:TEA domain-containing protein n=1 Tax=Cyclocybe aegerita TaxID=1973307 RepID=A0A8S0VTH5_CYCAE|nr:unnamed protein product [Cyclocybe aegerita]
MGSRTTHIKPAAADHSLTHPAPPMASPSPPSSVESSPAARPATRLGTLDQFKSPALPNPRTHDVFQSIVKGRKSWKTLRGGEIVWPPELEAALIEGLENYQPDDSRETRLLGRFPMRNRFISDWIYEKTGKRRTAKQVGSRLQQLRDTCGGKRLLNLLSPTRRPCPRPISRSPEFAHRDGHLSASVAASAYGLPSLRYESESGSDSSSASAPATPTEAHATLQNLLYRGVEPRVESIPETIVYIDLLPEDPSDHLTNSSASSSRDEERMWEEHGHRISRASPHPRRLRDIDPTITLISRAATTAHSQFTVYTDGGVVYSETVELEPLDPTQATSVDGALLYKTSLVPGYWDTIVNSSNASQYIILQRVTQDPSPSSPSSSPTFLFSAMYKFTYAPPHSSSSSFSPSPSPSFSHTHLEQSQSFSPQHHAVYPDVMAQFDNLISIDADGFGDISHMGMAHLNGMNMGSSIDSSMSSMNVNASMMGFTSTGPPGAKNPQQFFDLSAVGYAGLPTSNSGSMDDGCWSSSSSSGSGAGSVYASPVDCNQPTLPLPCTMPSAGSLSPLGAGAGGSNGGGSGGAESGQMFPHLNDVPNYAL